MKTERNASLVMMFSAMIGLLLANSPFGIQFLSILSTKLNLGIIGIEISISHIISDFLLAVFFFVAGMELKYELRIGTLSTVKTASVPLVAAIGGIAIPAVIYLFINWGTETINGWPIPTATDIAFVLGLLAIFGGKMPKAARIFLLAVAVVDDLVAITIIAVFYTTKVQPLWLLVAVAIGIAFRFLEQLSFSQKSKWLIRLIAGLLLWYSVYQSGVHATIAGVALGMLIPAGRVQPIIKKLQTPTNFFILPLFALSAVAVVFPTFSGDTHPVFEGVFFGLAAGKAIGITVAALLANNLLSQSQRLPLKLMDFIPLGFLAGVGFTVSLLMAHLAFANSREDYAQATLGVLLGSVLAGSIGSALVWFRANWHQKLSKQKV